MNEYNAGLQMAIGQRQSPKGEAPKMPPKEQQQAQEEAHKHFVIQEFSAIVLADGPASTLGQMSKEAHDEIRSTIIHEYTRRLVEANQGL